MRFVAAAVAALLLGAYVVLDSEGSEAGTALEGMDRMTITPAPTLGVGLRFVYNYMFLENVSDQPIIVTDVEPVWGEGPRVVKVVRVALGQQRVEGINFPWARYLTYPPAGRVEGKCVSLPLIDIGSRHTIEPRKDAPSIVLMFEAVKQGRVVMKDVRVTYTQDGVTFQQLIPLTFRFNVATKGSPPLRPIPGEAKCARGDLIDNP